MPKHKSRPLSERLFRLLSTPVTGQLADLPGPSPRVIVGNIGDFLGDEPAWVVAAEHARRHGSPSVLWLMNRPVVVLSDPRSIAAVLGDQSGAVRAIQHDVALAPVLDRWTHAILQKTGHREERAYALLESDLARTWRSALVAPLRALFRRQLGALVQRGGVQSDSWDDLLQIVRRLTFDAFALATFGQPLAPSAWRHFDGLMRGRGRQLELPLVPEVPLTPGYYRHKRAWNREFAGAMRAVRESPRTAGGGLVATLMQDGRLSDDRTPSEVTRAMGAMFTRGVLQTATGLLGCLYLLERHPAVAERVRAAAADLTARGDYDADALAQTPFIAATVRESVRLLPPVPLLARQVSGAGLYQLGEHRIPAGATLWLIVASAQRDPGCFDAPLRFVPQRWLDGGFERYPFGSGQYAPFGVGPQSGFGAGVATLVLQVALIEFSRGATVEFKSTRPYRQTRTFGVVAPADVQVRLRPAAVADSKAPTPAPDPVGRAPRRGPNERTAAVAERPPLSSEIPWVGSIGEYLRRPLGYFADEVARLGPVFRLRAFGQDMVVLTAGAGAPLVAAEPARCPFTRKDMFRAFATETNVDMFGADGAEHKRLRRMVRLGYSRHVVAQFVPDMVETTRAALRDWRPGDEVLFLRQAEDISVRCIMTSLTPIDMSGVVDAVGRMGDDVMYVTTGLRPDAIFKLPGYITARAQVEKAVDIAIKRHENGEFADGDHMRMLDALLATRDDDGNPLGARGVRGSAIYALCGTHVYLGRLIAFLVYEIVRNHELLQQVQREVDAAFALGPLSADVFRRMRHLRGAYVETLRMYPLVSGLLFRAARDFEVSGYRVEEGTSVLVSSIPDHYDPVIHASPFQFDPTRGANRRQAHKTGAFSPFGLRPRVCAAAGLVEVVVMTATVTLLHTLRLGETRPTYKPRLALQPLLGPADGLPLVVEHIRTDIDRIIDPSALSLDVDDDPLLVEHSNSLANFEVEAIDVASGIDIVREGEPPDLFYVIIHGTADVYQRQSDGFELRVASLTQGQIFGEVGLLQGRPRNATVRAREPMGLLRLDRDTFLTLVAESDLLGQELGRLLQRRFMRKAIAEALPRLSGQLAVTALEGMSLRQFGPGDVIIRQGDPADHFYILAAGRAEVIAEDSQGGDHLLTTLEKGAAFGEIGILTRRPRTATVRVSEHGPAVVMELPRERFEAVVGESPDATQDLALIIQRRILRHLETLEQGPTPGPASPASPTSPTSNE